MHFNNIHTYGAGNGSKRCIHTCLPIHVHSHAYTHKQHTYTWSRQWIEEIAEKAKALKVSVGTDSDTDIGPLISASAKKRVEDLIQSAVDEGARVLLDGRNVKVNGYANVCYMYTYVYVHVYMYRTSFRRGCTCAAIWQLFSSRRQR